ncbi:MAG TPA: gamma-glutamyltransferase [Gaiellaceae bacterium]|jgi:gamma-glutamyltranspeptidase/glutathione hydrolase|nr:gamma-glutamyltransferase [Gaiellaceae bacterium]
MTAAAIAAGHPATADAGAEILALGGSAADAAVAACLASCVAETVMTGLLGGGHALYYDAASRRAAHLDCFVTVPSGSGAPMAELEVPFGEEVVHYAVGASSCAVPGVPAGLDSLWRAHGRLPWAELVAPALRLAQSGVAMPPAHAACLAMLEPVMTMREGARMYAPAGTLLGSGGVLDQPGLVTALELVRDEGASTFYSGSIAEALLALVAERAGAITRDDLLGYEAVWRAPAEVAFAGRRVLTRGGLSSVPETLALLDRARGPQALLAALDDGLVGTGHTTNLTVVDADGNACVVTTSLGLGSGDWLPGLDLHLNSMLGETDLVRGPLRPGERMESMMAPTAALDGAGLELALGAAGGTRLRTALVGVLDAVLREGLHPQEAIDRPRFHPVDGLVNAEPGVDEELLRSLEAQGRTVRRWQAPHHYFGGVSAVGRAGAGADPRRSGAVRRARPGQAGSSPGSTPGTRTSGTPDSG